MDKSDDWRLDKIELEFKTHGDDAGKYVGRIRFSNGEYESFSFKVHPGMAVGYIRLIAADVVKAAEGLGDRLILSLGKRLNSDME